MSSVPDIEQAIRQLSPEELVEFRAWFAEFDADTWDRQIEAHIQAGRLDKFPDEALRDLRERRSTEL